MSTCDAFACGPCSLIAVTRLWAHLIASAFGTVPHTMQVCTDGAQAALLQVPADHAEVSLLGYNGAVPPLDMHALAMTYLDLAFPAPAVSSVSLAF